MERMVTLTRNNDFRRLYRRGKSMVHPLLVVYYSRNRLGCNRVGITTSKKIGKAVERNRARRVIREAYRALAPRLRTGYDLVFVARSRTAASKTADVGRVMSGMFKTAAVFRR